LDEMVAEVLVIPPQGIDKLLNPSADSCGGLVHVMYVHILRRRGGRRVKKGRGGIGYSYLAHHQTKTKEGVSLRMFDPIGRILIICFQHRGGGGGEDELVNTQRTNGMDRRLDGPYLQRRSTEYRRAHSSPRVKEVEVSGRE
jgi:hypothetical protein